MQVLVLYYIYLVICSSSLISVNLFISHHTFINTAATAISIKCSIKTPVIRIPHLNKGRFILVSIFIKRCGSNSSLSTELTATEEFHSLLNRSVESGFSLFGLFALLILERKGVDKEEEGNESYESQVTVDKILQIDQIQSHAHPFDNQCSRYNTNDKCCSKVRPNIEI
jgi:hypothetical protein